MGREPGDSRNRFHHPAADEYYGDDQRDRAESMRHLLPVPWSPTHAIVSDAASQLVSQVQRLAEQPRKSDPRVVVGRVLIDRGGGSHISRRRHR